jgi:ankyrin repeat protein
MNRIDLELIEASRENNLPEVSRLLSVGADVNATNDRSWTSLHSAIYKGHVQVVIELLGHGADIEAKDSRGWTPLHFACHMGHVAIVDELLSRGANAEANTKNGGDTPLHKAANKGHLAIVQALLSGGANIRAANNQGILPVYLAVGKGNQKVAKCLLQQTYATTRLLPLHELLKDMTNPNSSAVLPLREALHRNVLRTDDVVEILEYLVNQNPALISSLDQGGLLPLHVACRRVAAFAVVQSLVNLYKASVKSVTPQGDLPLFLACEMPETSLDTIFILMKLYPELVYR